jgi:hypothetical protein
MTIEKDCLIIPCSDSKSIDTTEAFNLYTGAMMQIINSQGIEDVLARFNLLFFSAKHGLIESSTIISPYDERMPKCAALQSEFIELHKRNANKLLSKYATKKSKLFVLLGKDYQNVFDEMGLNGTIKKFAMVYKSLNAKGIGVHRSRLKRIITKTSKEVQPVLFRSGAANLPEFYGYRAAGQAIGTSLAHFNRAGVLQQTIDAIHNGESCFVDNGLITSLSQKKVMCVATVFEEYIKFVSSFKKCKSLSIVIPDFPDSQDKALKVLREYKTQIQWLSKRCNVIVPMHKAVERSVVEQAHMVIGVLKQAKIVLGIPCRIKPSQNWRLDIYDIELLFMLKHKNGNPYFNKVHFLALSEVTPGTCYLERISLCKMYNMQAIQADCMRTAALFGNQATANYKGNIAVREVIKEVTELNTLRSSDFKQYDRESEIDCTRLWDEIRGFDAQRKAAVWNECYPNIVIDINDTDEEIEEVFETLTDTCSHDFIEKVKHVLYEIFSLPSHGPKFIEKRAEAIIKCYTKEDEARIPVQQPMVF